MPYFERDRVKIKLAEANDELCHRIVELEAEMETLRERVARAEKELARYATCRTDPRD